MDRDTRPELPTFASLSALALLRCAERHTHNALTALDIPARLVHCTLAQRYTLQALAILAGPCGVRLHPAPQRRACGSERVALLPEPPRP